MNCVLIKMGGNGVRFGASMPKQFYEIEGIPLFAYVLKKYSQLPFIDKYVIVTNGDWKDLTEKYSIDILGDKILGIVCGGNTNLKSTYNGVVYASRYLEGNDVFLVHDVTDPIICEKAIKNTIEKAKETGCAAVITEQVHTLYNLDENGFITGTIKKNTVGSGYSPEAFIFSIINKSFQQATEEDLITKTSAMALVRAKGFSPQAVVSHQVDLKITYKEDMDALLLMIKNGERLYNE